MLQKEREVRVRSVFSQYQAYSVLYVPVVVLGAPEGLLSARERECVRVVSV